MEKDKKDKKCQDIIEATRKALTLFSQQNPDVCKTYEDAQEKYASDAEFKAQIDEATEMLFI